MDFFTRVVRSNGMEPVVDCHRVLSRGRYPALCLLLGVGIYVAVTACNAEPPRRPGTTNRNGANGTGIQPGGTTSPQPLNTQAPAPEGVIDPNSLQPAPGSEQPKPSGDQTGTQPPKPDGGTGTGGDNPPPKDPPAPPAPPKDPPAPPKDPPPAASSGLTYRVFYKQAEPNVPNKRHGSWNLNCLTMRNSAEAQIAAPLCNKRLSTEGASKDCQVYHAENYGASKSVSADLVNGAIEVRMTVTSGAQYCPAGAPDDANGFRYVNPDGTQRAATTYSSSSAPGRYKCGKQPAGSNFKYKICFEDALESAQNIPGAWDFNDFIVVIESSKDVGVAGLSCNDAAIMQLPDSTCN